MTIRVTCKCGKQLAVKDEAAGRRVKCPQCQKPVLVPEPAEDAADADDEWDDAGEDEEATPPRRSASAGRRGKPAARGRAKSGSKGRKQTASSSRGLIIGLSAGGGVLVVALLAWLLWPDAGDDNVVANPSGTGTAAANSTDTPAGAPETTDTESTSPPAGGAQQPQAVAETQIKLKVIAAALSKSLTNDFRTSAYPAGFCDAQGRLLLSWRVALLPALGEQRLFDEFHLNEPWDSAHNQQLIPRMPAVFHSAGGASKAGHTYLRGFASDVTMFPTQGTGVVATQMGGQTCYRVSCRPLGQVTDGTSNTVLVVEAGDSVPWTSPEELTYDATQPFPELGGPLGGDFHAILCDGSPRLVTASVPEPALRAAVTVNDGQSLQFKAAAVSGVTTMELVTAETQERRYALGRMLEASPHTAAAQMTDQVSETVLAGMVAEDRAVPWTKPEDILFDDTFPSRTNAFAEGEMMFADGSVRYIHVQDGLIRDNFRGLFTIAGGEPTPLQNLYPVGHSLIQPTYPTTEEQARQAAARSERKNTLRQVAVAFMNYQQTFRYWPPATVYGPDGKPWHSWRVAILPFLGETALYNKYDATVPWDHPRNAEVLNAMPAVFRDPLDESGDNRTRYLLITGTGTAFPTATAGNATVQSQPNGNSGMAATNASTGSSPSGPSAVPLGPAPQVAMPRVLAQLPNEVITDAPFDVNQFWVSVLAYQNAAPYYLDALYEFHPSIAVCFPAAVQQQRTAAVGLRAKRSYNLQVEWYRDGATRNTAERDAVLAEHAAGFQKLLAAQQKPQCVFETGWDVPAIGPLFIASEEVARLAKLQVERDIERGDFDAAIRTTGMLLRFSRDLRVRTPLGVQFVADAIETSAGSSLVTPLLQSPGLTAGQCSELLAVLRQHDAAMQTLNPARTRLQALYVQRRLLLHQVQNSLGEFAPDRVKSAFGSSCESLGAALQASLNADRALAESLMTELPPPEMSRMLDVVARSMTPADYAASVALLKSNYQVQAGSLGQSRSAQATAFLEWQKQQQAGMASFMAAIQSAIPPGTPPAQQAAAALPALEKKLAEAQAPRGQFLMLLWSSKFENDMGDVNLSETELRGATRRSALLALSALRHWYATHAEPPTDLASVCRAAGLSDVPRDFYGEAPLRLITFQADTPPIQYPHGRPTDKPEQFLAGESVVYSIGPDSIDDRAASDWAYNPGAKGDWPFSLGRPQSGFPPTR